MANQSPTLLRRHIGDKLQQLRRDADYTRDAAAAALDISPATMGRIENARFKRLNPNDVRAMLILYGVTDESEQEMFLRLVRESRNRGWWQQYSDVLPDWFEPYVGLESGATELATYEPLLVPGLLQNECYVRTITQAGLIDGKPEDAERSVAARLSRQRLLDEEHRKFWVIVDEGVLRRIIGGRGVMHDQLVRLADEADRPNLTLQVLPFAAGGYPAMYGPFVVLGFPDPMDREVVYLDYETGALYLEELDELTRYRLVFNHMRGTALSPVDSVALITQVAKEYS